MNEQFIALGIIGIIAVLAFVFQFVPVSVFKRSPKKRREDPYPYDTSRRMRRIIVIITIIIMIFAAIATYLTMS